MTKSNDYYIILLASSSMDQTKDHLCQNFGALATCSGLFMYTSQLAVHDILSSSWWSIVIMTLGPFLYKF